MINKLCFKTIKQYVYYKYLLPFLIIIPKSVALGQATDTISVNTTNVSIIAIAVTILSVLTTIAVLIPTILSIVQIRRVDKEFEHYKELSAKAEAQYNSLYEKDRNYKPWQDILKLAVDKTEENTERAIQALREFTLALERDIKERQDKLQNNFEKEKLSLDLLTAITNQNRLELEKKPSTNDILVQIGEKYKIPGDLIESILQRVGMAILCLHDLTVEERIEICKKLSLNPTILDNKGN